MSGHIYNVRDGRFVCTGDSFKERAVAGREHLYSILPSRLTRVTLSAPADIKAGDTVPITFAAEGATSPLTYHLEVYGPDGERCAEYAKNFRVALGEGAYSFQLPFNAPAGAWQVEITNVNTGLKAVAAVAVD